MGFKDLFFISDESKEKPKEETVNTQESFKSKFPSSPNYESKVDSPIVNTPVNTPVNVPVMAAITPENPACAPHMDKIMKLYEDGFNGLNQDGYDFYEYFQAVVKTALNNPAMYGMALTMAQAMDSKVTKTSLITQSQFYIDEINKVYKGYVENGNQKRQQVLQAKGNEEISLTNELTDIKTEISRLSELKNQKENELSKIESKYSPEITDIECKLMANDIAKEKIIGTIKTVVDGINTNL